MNKGVLLSRAKYVLFLNAGDTLADGFDSLRFISILSDYDKEGSDVIAFSAQMKFNEKTVLIKPRLPKKMYPRMATVHQSMVYKRTSLAEHPYDIGFTICGDYDNFSKLFFSGASLKLDDLVVACFDSGGVSTEKPIQLFKESFKVSCKYYKLSFLQKVFVGCRLAITLVTYGFMHKVNSFKVK